MKHADSFSSFHPLVNFLYFALVLLFSMCLMNPLCLAISLGAAIAYQLDLTGARAVRRTLRYLLPLILLTALINPALNHEGGTILLYLPTGNPLTLESIAYGLAAACLLAAVLIWFHCYTAVMTSDKFLYLFGRLIPALSLVLSMALRFVPKFKAQLKLVSDAQRCIGRSVSDGRILRRVQAAITTVSILITWSLENAIETADSMKSRGYGLPGRTAFSIYRFGHRDRAALAWLLFSGVYVLSGWLAGGFDWRYFPTLKGPRPTALSLSFFLVYLLLCLTPLFINRREARLWRERNEKGAPYHV